MEYLWKRIEAWLWANAPEVAEGLNPPARTEEILATENCLGITFPEDLRLSYLQHNGQTFASPGLLDGWELLSLDRMRSEWGGVEGAAGWRRFRRH